MNRFLVSGFAWISAVLLASCAGSVAPSPTPEESKAPPPTPVLKPASFTTSNLTISPAEGEIDTPITIQVLVTNTGELAGTHEMKLEIDGVLEASENVTLAGGASQTVTFKAGKTTAKSYSVAIGGLSGKFTIKERPVPTPVATAPSPPPPPPPKGKIVYVAEGGITMSTGGEQFPIRWSVIEVINANGSDKRTLTKGVSTAEINTGAGAVEMLRTLSRNPKFDRQPRWSPDGSKIAFASNRDGNYEIYTMNEGGSDLWNLTTNAAVDAEPDWSPDGIRIVFTSTRDGNLEIYDMRADKSDVRRLTTNAAEDSGPAWSPDGTRIAFMSKRDGNYEIYVMNADGSGVKRLTENTVEDSIPAWSRDSSKIAFVSGRDANFEIYVMNADGSNIKRLTDNPAEDSFPTWSPEEDKIAFVSKRDGNFEIYVMDADGANVRRITYSIATTDYQPSWSR